jgi:hypothetical protein
MAHPSSPQRHPPLLPEAAPQLHIPITEEILDWVWNLKKGRKKQQIHVLHNVFELLQTLKRASSTAWIVFFTILFSHSDDKGMVLIEKCCIGRQVIHESLLDITITALFL